MYCNLFPLSCNSISSSFFLLPYSSLHFLLSSPLTVFPTVLGVRIPIWILLNLDRDPDFQHCRERVWREERRNFPSVLLLFLFIISSCHIPLLFLFFPSYTPPFSLLPIIYPSFFSSSRHILLLFLFFPSYTPPFSFLPVIYSSLFSSSRHILLLFLLPVQSPSSLLFLFLNYTEYYVQNMFLLKNTNM